MHSLFTGVCARLASAIADGCYFKLGAVHGVFSLSSSYDAVRGDTHLNGEYFGRENMVQLAALAFLSGHVRNGVIGTAQLARCASAICSREKE